MQLVARSKLRSSSASSASDWRVCGSIVAFYVVNDYQKKSVNWLSSPAIYSIYSTYAIDGIYMPYMSYLCWIQ